MQSIKYAHTGLITDIRILVISETIYWDSASNLEAVVLYTLSNIRSGSYDILKTLKQLKSRIPNDGDDYKRYLSQSVNKTIFITPLHSDELIKEIKSLNPKKFSGPDNISAKIINLCPNIFAEHLRKIFTRAIEKCEYPVQMKMAKVIALCKKGKRYEANNYRSISVLSIFNKPLEKLLCRQVMKFLYANNVLFKLQYGFRNCIQLLLL